MDYGFGKMKIFIAFPLMPMKFLFLKVFSCFYVTDTLFCTILLSMSSVPSVPKGGRSSPKIASKTHRNFPSGFPLFNNSNCYVYSSGVFFLQYVNHECRVLCSVPSLFLPRRIPENCPPPFPPHALDHRQRDFVFYFWTLSPP